MSLEEQLNYCHMAILRGQVECCAASLHVQEVCWGMQSGDKGQYEAVTITGQFRHIRESVDSLYRDGAGMPIVRVHRKAR